jgi:Zn finger protein HypA/HybF involved in hydrogenase expression
MKRGNQGQSIEGEKLKSGVLEMESFQVKLGALQALYFTLLEFQLMMIMRHIIEALCELQTTIDVISYAVQLSILCQNCSSFRDRHIANTSCCSQMLLDEPSTSTIVSLSSLMARRRMVPVRKYRTSGPASAGGNPVKVRFFQYIVGKDSNQQECCALSRALNHGEGCKLDTYNRHYVANTSLQIS